MTKQTTLLERWACFRGVLLCVGLTVFLMAPIVAVSQSPAPVDLGSAVSFAILAASTVTSTGAGTINGDIGVSPGSAFVPGTPSATVNGIVYLNDAVATQAQTDLLAAYNDAAGRTEGVVTLSGNIGGMTLAPGLYKSTSSIAISSGDLTLDAGNNMNSVWIFQIASTLTTTSGCKVILSNGANAGNIFWVVGSSATLGTNSDFKGSILAWVSITENTDASVEGRLLSHIGAVTFDGQNVGMSSPIAVCLSTLDAIFLDPATVDVSWTGEQQVGVAGYNVYRSWQEQGEYKKISERIIMAIDGAVTPHHYRFKDGTVEQGKPYFYKVESVHLDGASEWHGPVSPSRPASFEYQRLQESFQLMPVYPNPFNPQMTVIYELPQDAEITLTVYDIQGRQAAVLVNEYQRSGLYHYTWNPGQQQASGLYFMVMQTDKQLFKQKVSFVK